MITMIIVIVTVTVVVVVVVVVVVITIVIRLCDNKPQDPLPVVAVDGVVTPEEGEENVRAILDVPEPRYGGAPNLCEDIC